MGDRRGREIAIKAGFDFLALSPEHCKACRALPALADHRDPFGLVRVWG